MKYFLLILALFAFNANATNVKYNPGADSPEGVSVIKLDATCADQSTAKGEKGNILITCTKRVAAPPPAHVKCDPLIPTDVDVQPYYDKPGVSYTTKDMGQGSAYVMSFKTGDVSGSIQSVTVQEYAGDVVTRYLTISKLRCDFSIPPGYNQEGTTTKKFFTVGISFGPDFQVLEPNTQYFVNLKNENVARFPGRDTCDTGKTCGFVLNFYR